MIAVLCGFFVGVIIFPIIFFILLHKAFKKEIDLAIKKDIEQKDLE